jgi:ribosomal protein L21
MKRNTYRWLIFALMITVLCNVIGIAQSSGDPVKGQQLIALARQALGGEARLNEVQGLGLEGKINRPGQVQDLPAKLKLMFMTRSLAGTPSGVEENVDIDVRVGEPGANEKVMIFKNDSDKTHKVDGDKQVIVLSKDGMGEPGANSKVIFKDDSGRIHEITSDKKVVFMTKKDSKEINQGNSDTKIEKDVMINVMGQGGQHGGEACAVPALDLGRSMVGLLLKSPLPMEFNYIGDAENGTADAISIKDKIGFSGVLLLDKATHLPIGLNYRSGHEAIFVRAKKGEKINVEELKKSTEANQEQSEISLRFLDHRVVDGVLLPHRISRTVNGEVKEEYEIEKYDLNPTFKVTELRKMKANK